MATDKVPPLALNGEHIKITMYVGNTQVAHTQSLVRKGSLEPVTKDFEDKYLGRVRDRYDQILVGWKLDIEGDFADDSILVAWEKVIAQREAHTPIDQINFTIESALRDGRFQGRSLEKCTITWKMGFSGKDDRVMQSLSVKGEECKPVSL